MNPAAKSTSERTTQADRRARTRAAMVESAERGIARDGYANLVLERVAHDAGYTRGALYHLFANKEELALAVVRSIEEDWSEKKGQIVGDEADPVSALVALARGYAVYARRDPSRVMRILRAEFEGRGQDHAVGRAVKDVLERVIEDSIQFITAGRSTGVIPPGPPPRQLALAWVGCIEGLVVYLAGEAPHDELLAERATLGLLGLPLPSGHADA